MLGDIDFGGNNNNEFQASSGFEAEEDEEEEEDESQPSWANFDADEPQIPPLSFAKTDLKEVFSASAKGKGGKSGLKVSAAFYCDNSQLYLDIELTNKSQQTLSNFDIFFNKNPFALAIKGAGAMQFPAPG